MAYAVPTTRDNVFFYGSLGFYVEVTTTSSYQRHRHTRADYSRIYHLLTYTNPGPVLTKKGAVSKRQPLAHKDESEHFYCAQLLHYGLKPLKTKAAAKKQLLAAFGSGTPLKVPDHIIQLEKDLKQEYDAESAKAKKRYEQEKRKQKKAEVKRRGEAMKKQDKIKADVVGDTNGGKKAGSSKKRKVEEGAVTGPAKRSKGGKQAGGTKLSSLDVCGNWDISCPRLAEEYYEASEDLSMKMSPSRHKGGHLWISFDFGVISGIMRCSAPPTTTAQSCTFAWRGREAGEGEMYFGHYNTGTITFLGKGKLKGVIRGALMGTGKDVEFFGTQEKDNLRNVVWIKYVKQWKVKWRGMNLNAHEAESQARWGKWVSRDGCVEGPADSDTTAAEASDQEDEEDDYDDYY